MTKIKPHFFSLKNKKLKVFPIIIILSLVVFISSVDLTKVSAVVLNPNERTIIFDIIGSGTISWVYPNNTLLNGQTNSGAYLNVNLNDQIIITATGDDNTEFSYYFFNDVELGLSGNITGINPLTTTPIISSFLIQAVFIATDSFFNTVNIISNVNASIAWSQGNNSGVGGIRQFVNGTYVTFTAFPFTIESGGNADYTFDYFNITGGILDGTTTTNPLTLLITSGFNIECIATPEIRYFEVEFLESTGGSLSWHEIGNSTSFSHGDYLMRSGTYIEITATVDENYVFQSVMVGKYLVSPNYMYNPVSYETSFTIHIYRNYTFFGNFNPSYYDPLDGEDTELSFDNFYNVLISIFGNVYTDLVFIIFGVICSLSVWKFGMTGLIAGIGISTLLCTIAGILPIWGIGLCVVLDVTLIILGSGLLNKKQDVPN